MNKLQLEGQVAIITGAASPRDIDWTTAKRCVDDGTGAVVLDLDADAAERAAALLGPDRLGPACDVRDEIACQVPVGQMLDRLRRVDILVNNSGVSQSQRLLDSTQLGYDLVMNTSLRGGFNMRRAAVQHTGKRRVAEGVPLGRLDSAEDIADACLFLASDHSAYITGVVLDVSGGMRIH